MNQNPMFTSATRVVLLSLTVALVSITSYGAIFFTEERFSVVFTVFKDVMLLVAGAFFMKSSSDKPKDTEPTPPNTDNV